MSRYSLFGAYDVDFIGTGYNFALIVKKEGNAK